MNIALCNLIYSYCIINVSASFHVQWIQCGDSFKRKHLLGGDAIVVENPVNGGLFGLITVFCLVRGENQSTILNRNSSEKPIDFS